MSWQSETEKERWLEEWYEQKPNFRVKCREVSCEKKTEIIYVSIEKFKTHMERKHEIIASCEKITKKKAKVQIRYPGCNNWKYFMLWRELETLPPLLEDPQSAPEMVQYSIKCILCGDIIHCNEESARENHIKPNPEKHSDIENQYRERNIPDSWPWKYQKKSGDFVVECLCNCDELVELELSKYLKNHYKKKHRKIWDRKFNREEAYDQPGPSAGPSAGTSAGTSARSSARPSAKPCQPQAERTLQTEFKEHSWMTKCYDYQPNTYFNLQCRIENCQEIRYADIGEFRKHMKRWHNKTFKLEQKNSKHPHFEFNWKYFMQNEHRQIECLLCHNIVDDLIHNHLERHPLNQLNHDLEKLFRNITNSWSWKYMIYEGHYSVKCKLCERSVQLSPATEPLKRHYILNHPDQWEKINKDGEDILEQEEAHDQPGPSTQPLENRKDRTLKSEFEKHSWLKRCYDCQSDSYFRVRCLEETCDQKYVLYVKIDEFAKHMQTIHKEICQTETQQCSLPNHDISNWTYFMHRGQGKIECLVCEVIIDIKKEPTLLDTHAINHLLNNDLEFPGRNKRFDIIRQNWIWKYQEQTSDYIAKCRLCGEDSPEIHLTPNTEDLQKHYHANHGTKWNAIILPISLQEEMQKQAGPPHKVQKTS